MVKGSCVCGSLTYEFTGEPSMKTSGADRSLNIFIPNDSIKKTGGEWKYYTRKGDSGQNVTYWQCDQCSNILWVRPDAMDGSTVVKPGTIDDTDFMEKLGQPKAEVYCKNRWGWEQPIEGAGQKSIM